MLDVQGLRNVNRGSCLMLNLLLSTQTTSSFAGPVIYLIAFLSLPIYTQLRGFPPKNLLADDAGESNLWFCACQACVWPLSSGPFLQSDLMKMPFCRFRSCVHLLVMSTQNSSRSQRSPRLSKVAFIFHKNHFPHPNSSFWYHWIHPESNVQPCGIINLSPSHHCFQWQFFLKSPPEHAKLDCSTV